MNISVMSPHTEKSGVTSVASLIGLELAIKGKSVCLTHMTHTNADLHTYFKLKRMEDKTNNADQLVKLIKGEAIQPEKVRSYCKAVTDQLDIFSSMDTSYIEEDHDFMLKYIAGSFPHEIKIFDIDCSMVQPTAKDIILASDLAVLVLNQGVSELSDFAEQRDVILRRLAGKPVMVVVNKFNPVACSIREVANMAGIKKPENWFTLAYNPWVNYGCNSGELVDVHRKAKSKDARVIDLDSDLEKIATAVMKVKIALSKKDISKK